MKWKPVRPRRVQPLTGTYNEWKEQIAVDCENQCVYCAISESRYGGIDNFHVDHFRPKSVFAHLEQDIKNLYLACAICNRFKSNDWPSEPVEDNSHCGFPDPAVHDYDSVFSVDANTFEASSPSPAGRYTIERLYLNRPQLMRERRAFFVEEQIDDLSGYLRSAIVELSQRRDDPTASDLLSQASLLILEISDLSRKQIRQHPYSKNEITRPKKTSVKKDAKSSPKKKVATKKPAAKGTLKGRPRSSGGT